jgi:transposase
MQALREHARCTDFVLIGDSKLLSAANRQALLAAQVGYLAPLARTPELDAAFLAIPPDAWTRVEYVSERERSKPATERTTYLGWDSTAEVPFSDHHGRPQGQHVRRLFVISSEERAACRRHRDHQRARAEAEIAKLIARVGTRWYPTAERAQAKIEAILDRRHLRDLYEVTAGEQDGRPTVRCVPSPDALARAEAFDGYYVLETTRLPSEADASSVLTLWKGQWQIEQRQRGAKGPLRIRPLFVTSNRRIVGLITILGLALLVFSLIEREARRALGTQAKVPNLLAGQVAARPTGDNLLKALRAISLATIEIAGRPHRLVSEMTPLQQTLLRLLGVPPLAYQRLTL